MRFYFNILCSSVFTFGVKEKTGKEGCEYDSRVGM